jgi:hypothetical protein
LLFVGVKSFLGLTSGFWAENDQRKMMVTITYIE